MTASPSRAFPPSTCFICLFYNTSPKTVQDGQSKERYEKNRPSKQAQQTFSPSKKKKNVFSQLPTPLVPKTGFFGGGTEERMFMLASFLGCELSQGRTFLTQSMTKGMWNHLDKATGHNGPTHPSQRSLSFTGQDLHIHLL